MKEVIEFRINNRYANLLLQPNEIKSNSTNTVIYVAKDDEKFEKIRILTKQIREKYNDFFFLYSYYNLGSSLFLPFFFEMILVIS